MADAGQPSDAGGGAPGGPQQARKRRIPTGFSAEYIGRNVKGTGRITNLSLSGALIEPAEPLLISGGDISIRFPFFEDSLPVEIAAKVVRETASGFAVHFKPLDARLAQLLAVAISRYPALRDAPPQLGKALLGGPRKPKR